MDVNTEHTCCVGTCTNTAVVAVRFAPLGVHVFLYCRFHGYSREGTGPRWKPWQVLQFARLART